MKLNDPSFLWSLSTFRAEHRAGAQQVLTRTFWVSSAKSPPTLANQIPQPGEGVCVAAHTLYSRGQLPSGCWEL